jgi:hypothetical protein
MFSDNILSFNLKTLKLLSKALYRKKTDLYEQFFRSVKTGEYRPVQLFQPMSNRTGSNSGAFYTEMLTISILISSSIILTTNLC